jgi:hypothetical protein
MSVLSLTPLPATPAHFEDLEARGLIVRLAPGNHAIPVGPGEAIGRPVYQAEASHGGHMLLACTINQPGFQRFGWHEVPEEFLLIGHPDCEPLYLAFFLGKKDALQHKITERSLRARDFLCLQMRFNDPECSFFTMNPQVPHGECVARSSERPPSFYVTEPSGTTLCRPEWGEYTIESNFRWSGEGFCG